MQAVVGTVRGEDNLPVPAEESRRVVVIKVVGDVLERAGAEAIDEDVGLPLQETGKDDEFPVGGEGEVGDFLDVDEQPFVVFPLAYFVGVVVAAAGVLEGEAEHVAVGVPGEQGIGEVGIVLGFLVAAEDAARLFVVLGLEPDDDLAGFVGDVSITFPIGREAELVVITAPFGTGEEAVVFRLLPFYIFFIKNIIVSVPVN